MESSWTNRADAELRAIPIIAVTALTPGDRERCIAAGAEVYEQTDGLKQLFKIIDGMLHRSSPREVA